MFQKIMVGLVVSGSRSQGATFLVLLPYLLLFLLISSPLSARVNQNGDFQIWVHDSISGKFNANYGVSAAQEFRFGSDVSEFYQQFNEVMLVCSAGPSLEIAPGYKQFYSRISTETSKWRTFCIPQIDIKFILKNQSWCLINRNRFQYVLGPHNEWVFWPLFSLDTPFYYKNKGLKLYFSEEFFWREGHGIDQNRVKIGFKFQVGRQILLSTAYLLRNLKRNHEWTYQNVLHLSAEFNF